MAIYKDDLLFPDVLYPLIGRNIKQLRRQKHMTQEMLAELIDCDQKQISKIETGKARPVLSTYLRIANVFYVSIDRLLLGAIDLVPDLARMEVLANSLALNPSEQRLANDLLNSVFRYLSETK